MNPFNPSAAEKAFAGRLDKSFKSLRVIGRGVVTVDVQEVQRSPEFKNILNRAKGLATPKGVNK